MAKKILALYMAIFIMCPYVAYAEESSEDYDLVTIKAGEAAPFDGVLLSLDAAAKIAVDKKFEDAECDLRIGYELYRHRNSILERSL